MNNWSNDDERQRWSLHRIYIIDLPFWVIHWPVPVVHNCKRKSFGPNLNEWLACCDEAGLLTAFLFEIQCTVAWMPWSLVVGMQRGNLPVGTLYITRAYTQNNVFKPLFPVTKRIPAPILCDTRSRMSKSLAPQDISRDDLVIAYTTAILHMVDMGWLSCSTGLWVLRGLGKVP